MRRVLAAAVILVVAAALLVLAWPQLFGLERTLGIAQIVSLRGLSLTLAAVFVVLLLVFGLMYANIRRFTGAISALLLVFACVSLAVLATRGFGATGFEKKAPDDITVMTWNTLGDSPGAQAIADLALSVDADVVVLPETSAETAGIVAAIMSQAGAPMVAQHLSLDEISKARTTSVLISSDLGSYQIDDSQGTTETLPSLILRPADGSGPTIIAAHPVSPVPGEMAHWQQGLSWLADRCQGDDVILAGDLNSTLDHYAGVGAGADNHGGELGDCHDGAKATGNAAVGTWPTQLPQLLGAPIDHVMATKDWQFVGFQVIGSKDGDGSDHRPVVAQLRPTG